MVQHILQRSQTAWSNREIISLIVSARFLRQMAPDNRETKADLRNYFFRWCSRCRRQQRWNFIWRYYVNFTMHVWWYSKREEVENSPFLASALAFTFASRLFPLVFTSACACICVARVNLLLRGLQNRVPSNRTERDTIKHLRQVDVARTCFDWRWATGVKEATQRTNNPTKRCCYRRVGSLARGHNP